MLKKIEIILFCIILAYVNGSFINPYPRFRVFSNGQDPGDPLFLTPLINENKISEARRAALVTGPQLEQYESYSGYLTVETHGNDTSNLFFWYFPAVATKRKSAAPVNVPIILWLQGGPGASSLYGLFNENGPYEFDTSQILRRRQFSWHLQHHLIYIDNPVGTGFSFATNENLYATNEKEVGRDLYTALVQLYKLFPEFEGFEFFIAGESYAGKYVPALAYKIHLEKLRAIRSNIEPKAPINLKGIAIGNGLSDPIHQLKYSDYLYQIGLIDKNGHELFLDTEKEGINCIKARNMSCAFDAFDRLINMDESPYGSIFKNLTGYDTYFNYLKTNKDNSDKIMGDFLQSASTRRSIHVGNQPFHDTDKENKVEIHLKNDIMDSVAHWISQLLDSYRVCIYSGQLDIIVAYPLTLNYLQKLKFNGDGIYKTAERHIWKVNNEIAGYAKEANNLVEVLVRNAGHMAPRDQPKWVYDMITRFTRNKGFY